jgi:coenzyme F420-reducing hydrogenase delta subunit
MDTIGINPDRVQMVNVSAAMAVEFIENITSLNKRLEEIGPSPLKTTL